MNSGPTDIIYTSGFYYNCAFDILTKSNYDESTNNQRMR